MFLQQQMQFLRIRKCCRLLPSIPKFHNIEKNNHLFGLLHILNNLIECYFPEYLFQMVNLPFRSFLHQGLSKASNSVWIIAMHYLPVVFPEKDDKYFS